MFKIALIFIGGGLGSLARYGTGILASKLIHTTFPVGTLISNVLACTILALIAYTTSGKLTESSWVQPLLLIGFCGGFSTFSTFSHETVQLINTGYHSIAVANIFISLLSGLGVVFLFSQYSK